MTNASTGVINVTTDAAANASASSASASASNSEGIYQYAYSQAGNAAASLTNAGAINITSQAVADAEAGSDASAYGYNYYGISQGAYAYTGGDAIVSLANTGAINITSAATAVAGSSAYASVTVYEAITQNAGAIGGGDATASLANSGTINITGSASATGGTGAYATAELSSAIYQSAYAYSSGTTSSSSARAYASASNPSGNASVSLTNSSTGVINIAANAVAVASASSASAYAENSSAIYQYAYSQDGDAAVTLTNSGTINIKSNATAESSGTDAYASASVNTGIYQYANAQNGTANATVNNSGTINVLATAAAVSGSTGTNDSASAYAYVTPAIYQYVSGSTATVTNSGILNAKSTADAAGDEYAYASASATGISQNAYGADATAVITNASTGVINVAATASAEADVATATAEAFGAFQYASATSAATVSFSNAGTFNIDANAAAAGGSSGFATAYASGVTQQAYGTAAQFNFTNSGTFTVDAAADAAGSEAGTGYASALGYYAYGSSVTAAFTNSGTMTVKAQADGDTYASANAVGVSMQTGGGSELLTGTLRNSGPLTVSADAAGGTLDLATATGVYLQSGINTLVMTNTGAISTSAITTGGAAAANGIVVFGNGLGLPTVTDIFTLNNTAGSIIARTSVDGGLTWTHGTAIDTSLAPNAAIINLAGNGNARGSIYGNIDLSADDTINVLSGETMFDGVVNPLGELEGTLNILSGGTLYLVDEPTSNTSYDGAARVNVDALTIAAGGRLALQLPSYSSGSATYPQIFANTANITGATLEVRPSSANGLYANSYTYDNVIDANTLTGTFASLVVVSSGTPLLTLAATYDGNNNVDLSMTRVAFNNVAGLTKNQASAGAGIETTYSSGLTGPYATMLATLFSQNAVAYASSLDQLAATQYAGYLHSLTGVGNKFNGILGEAGECAVSTIEERRVCRNEGGGRIWGQADYGRVTKDGDIEAAGYKANQWSIVLGTDFEVSPNLVLGVAGAYVKHDLDFDRYNGKIESDGFQAGLYAAYDTGSYYAKAVASYSDLKGNSSRAVSIGTTAGLITGNPEATIWALSGEVGYRADLGSSTLTPYVGIDYTSAKLKSFTESGVVAANLDVADSDHNRTASNVGVKWAGEFGKIVPELNLGWRHEFGDQIATFDAAFDASPGSNFSVISPTGKQDSAVVGLSVAARLNARTTVRLGYQGRFNSDLQSHSGGVNLTIKLGGN